MPEAVRSVPTLMIIGGQTLDSFSEDYTLEFVFPLPPLLAFSGASASVLSLST